MIRITRSLYSRHKCTNYFLNVQHCVSPKQIAVPAKGCHTRASPSSAELEENNGDTEKSNTSTLDNVLESVLYSKTPRHLLKKLNYTGRSNAIKQDVPQLELVIRNLLAEDDVMQVTKNLSPGKIIVLLKHLAEKRNRAMKLLKVLSDRLTNTSKILEPLECSSILYSCHKLSYRDKELFDKISKDLTAQMQKFYSGSLPSAILLNIGLLKYRNCELIEQLLKVTLAHSTGDKRTSNISKCVSALGMLNYSCPFGNTMLQELDACTVVDYPDLKHYLTYVWSCIILNHFPLQHISTVLSSNFIEKCLPSVVLGHNLTTLEEENVGSILKLMNIQAAVKCIVPEYNGPFFNNTLIMEFNDRIHNNFSKSKSQFLTSVVDGLCQIFPNAGYLNTNVDVGGGFFLDVECCVDSNGNPVPLKKRDKSIKIGIVLINFHDMCMDNEGTPVGLCALKKRVLEAKGYKVITVPCTQYHVNMSLSQKVEYLRNNLNRYCSSN